MERFVKHSVQRRRGGRREERHRTRGGCPKGSLPPTLRPLLTEGAEGPPGSEGDQKPRARRREPLLELVTTDRAPISADVVHEPRKIALEVSPVLFGAAL